ncbi:MAG: molybdenum cofactor guanylyltransferase, partial [Actinomycetota bacterium]|nr:molybdenum cofactor guanylyltransferase [Actinomycetota bacterium]
MQQAKTTERLPITAAVLAGGRSMRMGVDKTLLDIDGEPLVAHVVDIVSAVCASTIVVTNRPEALDQAGLPADVRVFRDEVAYQGPLGGLVTAMGAAAEEWVLAVAADMPWLEPGVVRALWAARDGADVVMPVSADGPEPLLALYRTAACLPAAREALASGRRRLVAMLPSLSVVEIPVETLRGVDPELRSLVNINTPEDLAEVRADAHPPASADRGREPVRLQVLEVGTRRARGMPVERP